MGVAGVTPLPPELSSTHQSVTTDIQLLLVGPTATTPHLQRCGACIMLNQTCHHSGITDDTPN